MSKEFVLKTLPKAPGVYLFKDAQGTVIYIGKAVSIRDRVSQYFQNKHRDWKVDGLLAEHSTVEHIETKNETEALLLEAQLISKYKPKYNVLLKEGQPFLYLKFSKDPIPVISIVRQKKEKGTYFGPFLHKKDARAVYRFLMQTFRLNLCNKKIENGCLDYHLGLCAGSCKSSFDVAEYMFRMHLAMEALRGNHAIFLEMVKKRISEYNKQMMFEKSKRLQEYLYNLDTIFEAIRTRYHEDKYKDDIFVVTQPVPKESGIATPEEVGQFLQLDKPIKTIDCFDISHFQSSYLVGSCVRFTNGKPDKNMFRRFKIRTLLEQNDYAALQEIVGRRYKEPAELPDLILIDGGKGQLSAVKAILPHALCISLAKREETIFSEQFPEGKKLDMHNQVAKLLIALRDYAHHFAVSYHRLRRKKGLEGADHETRAIHYRKPRTY